MDAKERAVIRHAEAEFKLAVYKLELQNEREILFRELHLGGKEFAQIQPRRPFPVEPPQHLAHFPLWKLLNGVMFCLQLLSLGSLTLLEGSSSAVETQEWTRTLRAPR